MLTAGAGVGMPPGAAPMPGAYGAVPQQGYMGAGMPPQPGYSGYGM